MSVTLFVNFENFKYFDYLFVNLRCNLVQRKLLLKVYIEFAPLRFRTEDFLGPDTQILSSCSTVSKINYFCSSASINLILNLFYHMIIYCEFQA